MGVTYSMANPFLRSTLEQNGFFLTLGGKMKSDLILRKLPFLPTCVSLHLNANIFGLVGCHTHLFS